MMTSQTDILVIGGGPAGIEAAAQCAKGGKRTLLVSATSLGGRATWGSLVPSKAWLAAAHAQREAKTGEHLGLAPLDPRVDISVLHGHIQALARDSAARYQARLAGVGVEIAQGKALLSGPGAAVVTNGEDRRAVRFETVIVCSGSEPRFFPDVKPNGERLIAPRLAAKLPEVPPSIIMVGAGVTGCGYRSLQHARIIVLGLRAASLRRSRGSKALGSPTLCTGPRHPRVLDSGNPACAAGPRCASASLSPE
jgi:dihydrolipoamide dehydrogenase